MKKLQLSDKSGFVIKLESKRNNGIVCSARSQCRTTHKRKDC